jgi:hypothetical protein
MSMDLQTPPAPSLKDANAANAGKLKQFFTETLPNALHSAITWPLRLSTPAKISWLLFLFLLTSMIVVMVVVARDPRGVSLYTALPVGWVVTAAVLVILIPILVYQGLKLWVLGEKARYPDIAYAWNAGLQALQENGLDCNAIPIFLVLGSSGEHQEKALMQASGRAFRVFGAPQGPAPIHWYGCPDSIFLFCSEVGALSTLTQLVGEAQSKQEQTWTESMSSISAVPTGSSAPPAPSGGSENIQGTITMSDFPHPGAAPPKTPGPGGGEPANAQQGTMMFDQGVKPASESPPPSRPASQPAAPAVGRRLPRKKNEKRESVTIPTREAMLQGRRLRYLGRQIKSIRYPLCPINGILTLLSFECIELSRQQAQELEEAVRADLAALRQSTFLRCPVTALIADLEGERGFSELIRRVGRERAASQRFGKGYPLRTLATSEDLAALGAHVSGAFEDWIYMLFREDDAISRPGNPLLYSLMCKIRCNLKGRLTDILANCYGHEPQSSEADSTKHLFSGCYFSATGDREEQRAFVAGVIDKLEDEQEEIEWSEDALRIEQRFRWMTYLAWLLSAFLLAGLIIMILKN